ncbi:hypothetical protein SAMN06265222_108201 [Neorhodopirellula lusitana]|uniref:Secreted protein n=1 Tax=Neorhodopirellula lusitana TaxID=445327 RepID=A0ABY1QBC9_9BACT|nr:hypothetical protein [Neorhodopirellula lusitana]SMP64304.1 hypothetical protein SAMN06265222_108201 [Neorhodopirellula lusitana]
MTKSGVLSAIILALLLSVRATTADEPSVSTEPVVMPVELQVNELGANPGSLLCSRATRKLLLFQKKLAQCEMVGSSKQI